MKNTLKLVLFVVGLSALASLNSCTKQLNLKPKYGFNSEAVYKDPKNYIHVLAKLYAGLATTGNQGPAGSPDIASTDEGFSQYVRALYNLQVLPTDEAVCGWNDIGIPDLCKSTWSAENTFVKMMYNRIFFQIALCNEFVRETTDAKMDERSFSEADKAMIRTFRAEARFLRALSYSHAMDLFGNVPFVDENDLVGAFMPERITRTNLFSYVESELKAVENELLPSTSVPYGRASSSAAQFLLARIYLNAEVYTGTQRYQDCATYCTKVITEGGFSLDDKYTDLFRTDNNTSPEIIFPVVYDALYTQSYGGTTFLTCASIGGSMVAADYGVSGGWAGLRATPQLVDKFTDSITDGRYQFYTDGQVKEITTLSTFTDGYALPKYQNVSSTGQVGSNNGTSGQCDTDFPMFRLADVYLMYAECAARGFGSKATGLGYLQDLKDRAYGANTSTLADYDLPYIIDERARELHWECTRRSDLIRFDLFASPFYLWAFKGGDDAAGTGINPNYELYPIPNADLVLNTNLIQNPGY
jgi:hypothetical protein